MKALPKILLALTGVAALSLTYPASVQAVPTTYQYTGNPFTLVAGDYTTSMFVTVMVTLAGPLGAHMPLTDVTSQVTAFTFFDGVQTITNMKTFPLFFLFSTDGSGHIVEWIVQARGATAEASVGTEARLEDHTGSDLGEEDQVNFGVINNTPGEWTGNVLVPDAGFTLSLMTLTLMALGLVARRFQRAAA
jgi:hypothetical protein